MTELTAGEKAYFESGGSDTAGILSENPAAGDASAAATADAAKDVGKDPAKDAATAAAATVAAATAADTGVAEPPEPGEEEVPAADGKTRRRMVDSRALKAERDRARKLEAELTAERETRARVDERLKMLSEAITTPEPGAEAAAGKSEVPNPEEDIFGYVKHLAERLDQVGNVQTATQAESAQERQVRTTVSTYQRDSAAFAARQPDFMDGYNFLLTTRQSQLELQGYSPEEVSQHLFNEEMSLVNRSIANKKSPAEQIYALAKSMGYAPKAPAAAANGNATVAAAAPAAAATAAPAGAPKAPNVTEEIDRIKAGKAASMSLSNGGGAAGEELSLEWLANAPLKEFEAFMNKPGNREKVERAMGRAAA